MSSELVKARKKLNSVTTMLKKGKYMTAIQGIHDGLILLLKTPTIKSERDEFEELLKKVTYSLSTDAELRKLYPLVISYEPGKERALLDAMRELLQELQKVLNEEVQDDMQAILGRKRDGLDAGQSLLDQEDWDGAKELFDALVKEFGSDTDLKADIADRYLNAGRFKEAFHMLDDALRDDPNAIHLYNRIGMVLRKMKDYDTAEKYYLKALSLSHSDEYLHYNVGRLYYDWRKWAKMAKAAEAAVSLNPDFAEAVKMLKFARKKMAE
ncbi:MAG: tetratricopeptide repeat protein [Pseudodesulfovibrio sp.]|uniref:Tetratricopeptide TPR_1 repeat-containing protein n=1 Tax=Pseudodesulfovibrio aespoeensis (strain ATCC 700646 / DSM 10631 / Aspo-2) TaxID=643562 RepID=E6VTC7_PSEA9|nr:MULTISPECIES: tetratricopeptide repeat protein [Pseudodesulfovibrio]MBU4245341.1 tetratricopeptide repeat protein [Pseudomonadota bacterium]ADU63286.1 Tetratricopeptide TPR_1 repeat-containing protein [Pseudodesulfovibrio aespoeensis Aspo-2]MBU4378157.1 tetratricopeptide repeat protein [Pseudomonadota bacterium]MBU4474976.1 tetratricopeptide repeat protein [Pseudomonadota bacterium]MBU4516143.1 tetratricopeptide repeat protein [Pseudomonadota bacterium]